jgi:predicted RNase H-like HicB family nuclease
MHPAAWSQAMNKVNDTLDIEIKYFTGQEEGEDDTGTPYYTATCVPVGLVTYGETFEELLGNIQEGLAAAMEGEDTIAIFNVIPTPRIVLHMEMPDPYAKIA